jgi:hypothetical protein
MRIPDDLANSHPRCFRDMVDTGWELENRADKAIIPYMSKARSRGSVGLWSPMLKESDSRSVKAERLMMGKQAWIFSKYVSILRIVQYGCVRQT